MPLDLLVFSFDLKISLVFAYEFSDILWDEEFWRKEINALITNFVIPNRHCFSNSKCLPTLKNTKNIESVA